MNLFPSNVVRICLHFIVGICEAKPSRSSEDYNNKGDVIGVAVGSAVGIALTIAIVVFIYKKRHTSHRRTRQDFETEETMTADTSFSKNNPIFNSELSAKYHNNQLR